MTVLQTEIPLSDNQYISVWLPKPQKISSQTWPNKVQPLVSICCITYEHGNYIRDAIEGFLMQETTFQVEILIHDDASSDQTADIVRAYEAKYPELIRAVYQTENQYSKEIAPVERVLFSMACGTYIALCEGDDYWTDPLKLQKQVEFLEKHPGYSACVGGYTRLYDDTQQTKNVMVERFSPKYKNGFTFTLQEMEHAWLTKTLTAVFRKNVLKEVDLSVYTCSRDIHLFYHLIKNHKGFYFQENFGIYRIHQGGINSMKQGEVNKNTAYNCYRELYLQNNDEFTRSMCLRCTLSLLNFNLFNRYKGSNISGNLRLFFEAVVLIRALHEIKWLLAVFLKREWKDKIKELIKTW